MTRAARPGARRGRGIGALASRCAALAAPLLVLLTVVVLGPTSAAAPTDLVTVTPAAGDRMALAPLRVVLDFSGELSPATTRVVVRGPDGTQAQGAVMVTGGRVMVPVLSQSPGRYRVAYRVTSVDGDRLAGRYGYTVARRPHPVDRESSGVAVAATPASAASGAVGSPWWVLALLAPLAISGLVPSGRRSGSRRRPPPSPTGSPAP